MKKGESFVLDGVRFIAQNDGQMSFADSERVVRIELPESLAWELLVVVSKEKDAGALIEAIQSGIERAGEP